MNFRIALHRVLQPYPKLNHYIREIKWFSLLIRHRVDGSPIPPSQAVKLFWLNHFQKKYSLRILIETGTFFGSTIEALSQRFQQIYSIELDYVLYEKAFLRFQRANHIHILFGDSGKVLPDLLCNVQEAALFWLDGHYSGGITSQGDTITPILEEIRAIRNHPIKDHVILIDDARLFRGEDQYPRIEEVIIKLKEINHSYHIQIKDDMIQAFPQVVSLR